MIWDIDIKSPNIEIKELINEINKCLDNKLIIPALYMALTIPDACGNQDYPALNKISGQRYKEWFNKNVDPVLNPLRYHFPEDENSVEFDGNACYKLRCALLHSGETDIKNDVKVDNFYIDFRTEMTGLLYRTDSDLVLEVNSDGTSTWVPRTNMSISAILIVNSIVEAANKWVLNKDKTDETTVNQSCYYI